MRSAPVSTLHGSPAGPARSSHARRMVAKSAPATPRREPVLHSFGEMAQHRLGSDRRPVLGEMRGGAAEIVRVPGQIDAEADDGGYGLLTGPGRDHGLGEDAGALGLADQDVVGPLQAQARRGRRVRPAGWHRWWRRRPAGPAAARQRACSASSMSRLAWRLPGPDDPLPAAAAAPRRLAPRHDPQRARLAARGQRKRLAVGGANLVENEAAKGLRHAGLSVSRRG